MLWPVLALIDVPFVQLGARILKLRRPTFGATYLLVLIAGVAMFLASAVVRPILPEENTIAEVAVLIGLAVLVHGWAFGYFLTDTDDASIGYWKGVQIFLIASALFAVLLFVVALVAVGVAGVWKT